MRGRARAGLGRRCLRLDVLTNHLNFSTAFGGAGQVGCYSGVLHLQATIEIPNALARIGSVERKGVKSGFHLGGRSERGIIEGVMLRLYI